MIDDISTIIIDGKSIRLADRVKIICPFWGCSWYQILLARAGIEKEAIERHHITSHRTEELSN